MFFASIFNAIGGLRAATNIHQYLLNNVLRFPLSFFDTTPLGRILNRFSNDVNVLDIILPSLLYMGLNMTSSVNK